MKRNEGEYERDRKERNHTQHSLLSPVCTFTIFRGFHGDELAEFMARCSRQCWSSETSSAPISLTRVLPGPQLFPLGQGGVGL